MDLTSLKQALTSLKKAIERCGREPEDEEVRDSVVQRFEYIYEWNQLPDWLRRAILEEHLVLQDPAKTAL